MMGIFAGFIEETGWMGFAFPKMRARHGLIRTSVYLGLIHGLWHFPLWFLLQSSALGVYWYPYFIAFVVFIPDSYYITIQYFENIQGRTWDDFIASGWITTYLELLDLADGESVTTPRSLTIRGKEINLGDFQGLEVYHHSVRYRPDRAGLHQGNHGV
jgi:hypothetical protein